MHLLVEQDNEGSNPFVFEMLYNIYIMEEIISFHHYVMVYLTMILFGVAYILGETLRSYSKIN